MRLIAELPIEVQFEIFYRHFIFEFFALLLSVYISVMLYEMLKKMHGSKKYNWKQHFMFIVLVYIVMIICTFVAAVLEGGAFV